MNLKHIIKQVLSEADVDVRKLPSMKNREGGEAASLARAKHLQGKVEKNLSSLGVYDVQGYMEGQGIFSLERIKNMGEPFSFSFKDERGGTYDGKAMYDEKLSTNTTLVLKFKSTEGIKKIHFPTKSLLRPFMHKSNFLGNYRGDKRALLGLQEGEIVDVVIKLYGKSSGVSKAIRGENISRVINLLTEDEIKDGQYTTKIKILKIGIERAATEKRILLSNDVNLPVEGKITIDRNDLSKLKAVGHFTAEDIMKRLESRRFYVRLSKDTKNTIILSTTKDEKDRTKEFLIISSMKNINEKEPTQWSNLDVTIGQRAMNRDEWPNIKGKISYLKLV